LQEIAFENKTFEVLLNQRRVLTLGWVFSWWKKKWEYW